MFLLRDLPSAETLTSQAERYPNVEPDACEAFMALLRVASDALDASEQWMSKRGLSQGRFTVLTILNRDPDKGMTPSDLAERAGVTRATMTGLLDGLEKDDLVKREPHPQDRRMLVVALTSRGREQLDEMLPDYYRRIGELMRDLSRDERSQLIGLVRRIGERVYNNGKA